MSLQTTYAESELVALLKRGEEQAYSYLYDHYSGALFGVILTVVGRQELAEDVLQEVFLKIYRNIDQYDAKKGRLYTWILQIARNTAIDTIRSKEFRDAKKIHTLDNDVNVDSASLSTIPYIDHVGLDSLLARLNEDQRKVIDLAYFKGYTQEEISSELHIPLGTIKTRIRNALIRLRELLNIT